MGDKPCIVVGVAKIVIVRGHCRNASATPEEVWAYAGETISEEVGQEAAGIMGLVNYYRKHRPTD